MKIAINGDIIDTKDIYKITKIKLIRFIYDDVPIDEAEAILFKIISFGKRELLIKNDIARYDKNGIEQNKNKHEELKKMKKIREDIIKIWNDDKSDIPQFNT